MLSMGDECGRTQRGNNNAYCHDAEWNWFDWSLPEREKELLHFTRQMIRLRKTHPLLRHSEWLTGRDQVSSGYPDISWHGITSWKPDWSVNSRSLAFLLCGKHSAHAGGNGDFLYAVFNSWHEPLEFQLPVLPKRKNWHFFADSSKSHGSDIVDPGEEVLLENQKSLHVESRSCIILIGR